MVARSSILLLAVAVLSAASSEVAVAEHRNLGARVEALVRDFMAGRAPTADDASAPAAASSVVIPAMGVAIGRDGTLLYADGCGDAAEHRQATAR